MKTTNLKRFLSFLLVLLMVFTILPSNTLMAFAAEAEETIEIQDMAGEADILEEVQDTLEEDIEDTINEEEAASTEPEGVIEDQAAEANGAGEETEAAFIIHAISDATFDKLIAGQALGDGDFIASTDSCATMAAANTAYDGLTKTGATGVYIEVIGSTGKSISGLNLNHYSTLNNIFVRANVDTTLESDSITFKNNLGLSGKIIPSSGAGNTVDVSSDANGTVYLDGTNYFHLKATSGSSITLCLTNGWTALYGFEGFAKLKSIGRGASIRLEENWKTVEIPELEVSNGGVNLEMIKTSGTIKYVGSTVPDLGTAQVSIGDGNNNYSSYYVGEGDSRTYYVKKEDGKYYSYTEGPNPVISSTASSLTDADVQANMYDCCFDISFFYSYDSASHSYGDVIPVSEGTKIVHFTNESITGVKKYELASLFNINHGAGGIDENGNYISERLWPFFQGAYFNSEAAMEAFRNTMQFDSGDNIRRSFTVEDLISKLDEAADVSNEATTEVYYIIAQTSYFNEYADITLNAKVKKLLVQNNWNGANFTKDGVDYPVRKTTIKGTNITYVYYGEGASPKAEPVVYDESQEKYVVAASNPANWNVADICVNTGEDGDCDEYVGYQEPFRIKSVTFNGATTLEVNDTIGVPSGNKATFKNLKKGTTAKVVACDIAEDQYTITKSEDLGEVEVENKNAGMGPEHCYSYTFYPSEEKYSSDANPEGDDTIVCGEEDSIGEILEKAKNDSKQWVRIYINNYLSGDTEPEAIEVPAAVKAVDLRANANRCFVFEGEVNNEVKYYLYHIEKEDGDRVNYVSRAENKSAVTVLRTITFNEDETFTIGESDITYNDDFKTANGEIDEEWDEYAYRIKSIKIPSGSKVVCDVERIEGFSESEASPQTISLTGEGTLTIARGNDLPLLKGDKKINVCFGTGSEEGTYIWAKGIEGLGSASFNKAEVRVDDCFEAEKLKKVTGENSLNIMNQPNNTPTLAELGTFAMADEPFAAGGKLIISYGFDGNYDINKGELCVYMEVTEDDDHQYNEEQYINCSTNGCIYSVTKEGKVGSIVNPFAAEVYTKLDDLETVNRGQSVKSIGYGSGKTILEAIENAYADVAAENKASGKYFAVFQNDDATSESSLVLPSYVKGLLINNGESREEGGEGSNWLDRTCDLSEIQVAYAGTAEDRPYIYIEKPFSSTTFTVKWAEDGKICIPSDSNKTEFVSVKTTGGEVTGTLIVPMGRSAAFKAVKVANTQLMSSLVVYDPFSASFVTELGKVDIYGDVEIGFGLPSGATNYAALATPAYQAKLPKISSIDVAQGIMESVDYYTGECYDESGEAYLKWETGKAYYYKKTEDIPYTERFFAFYDDSNELIIDEVRLVQYDDGYYKLVQTEDGLAIGEKYCSSSSDKADLLENRAVKADIGYFIPDAENTYFYEWGRYYELGLPNNTKLVNLTTACSELNLVYNDPMGSLGTDGTYKLNPVTVQVAPKKISGANGALNEAKYNFARDFFTEGYANATAAKAAIASASGEVSVGLNANVSLGQVEVGEKVDSFFVYINYDESNPFKVSLDGIKLNGKTTNVSLEGLMLEPDAVATFKIEYPENSTGSVALLDAFGDNTINTETVTSSFTTNANDYLLKIIGTSGDLVLRGQNEVKGLDISSGKIVTEGVEFTDDYGNVVFETNISVLYIRSGYDSITFNKLVVNNEAYFYFEGYDDTKLPEIKSITGDGQLTIGYGTYKVFSELNPDTNENDYYIAVVPSAAMTKDKLVLKNLPTNAAKAAAFFEKVNVIVPDGYSYNNQGKIESGCLYDSVLDAYLPYKTTSVNTKLTIGTVDGKTPAKVYLVEEADRSKIDALTEKTPAELKTKAITYAETTETIHQVMDGETPVSGKYEVTLKLERSFDATSAAVFYCEAGETAKPVYLGQVDIYLYKQKAPITALDMSKVDLSVYDEYSDTEVTDGTLYDVANKVIASLPETVSATREDRSVDKLDINWTIPDLSAAAGKGKSFKITGTINIEDMNPTYATTKYDTAYNSSEKTLTIEKTVKVWAPKADASSIDVSVVPGVYSENKAVNLSSYGNAVSTVKYAIDDGEYSAAKTFAQIGSIGVDRTMTIKVIVPGDSDNLIPDSDPVEFSYSITKIAGTLRVEPIPDQVYTGSKITPDVVVYDSNEKLLTIKKDYTVSYLNNVAAAADNATRVNKKGEIESAAPTVVIKGKGNYSGTVTMTFDIVAKAIPDNDSSLKNPVYNIIAKDGKADLTKWFAGVVSGKTTLKKDTDYTVAYVLKSDSSAVSDPTNVSVDTNEKKVYTATITFKGNYSGTISRDITAAGLTDFSKAKISGIAAKATYTGGPVTLDLSNAKVTLGKDTIPSTDYTVAYDNNTDAGSKTAKLIFTHKDASKYIGSAVYSFSIEKVKLSDKKAVTITIDPAAKLGFTGTEVTPAFIVKSVDGTITYSSTTDYEVTYTKNVAAGKATAVLTARDGGRLAGNSKQTFTITKVELVTVDKTTKAATFAEDVTIYVIDPLTQATTTITKTGAGEVISVPMSKAGVKPVVNIVYATTGFTYDLVENKDYTVAYSKNKAVSGESEVASIKITAKGSFTGTVDGSTNNVAGLTFKVLPKTMTSSDITIEATKNYMIYKAGANVKYNYSPVIYDGKTKLVVNKDYTLSYEYNTNADIEVDSSGIPNEATTAYVYATGIGSYTGTTARIPFTIVPTSFDKLTFIVASQSYVRGVPSTISNSDVTIKLNSKATAKLFADDEFEILQDSYVANTKVGKAKVTIVSKNPLYPGSKQVTFNITKAPTSGLDISLDTYYYSYTKAGAKPVVTVYDGDQELVLGKDYTVKYKNNAAVAAADATKTDRKGNTSSIAPTVVITGKGNYAGSVEKTFTITKANFTEQFKAGNIKAYVTPVVFKNATTAIKPAPVITQDGKKLTAKDTKKENDYTFKYVDAGGEEVTNTKITGDYGFDAPVFYVEILPLGNYYSETEDTVKVPVYVLPVAISKVSIGVDKDVKKTYNGEEQTLDMSTDLSVSYKVGSSTISFNGYEIEDFFDIDYSSYTKNVNVGTAKVNLIGKKGTPFEGVKKSLSYKIYAYDNAAVPE